MSSFVLLWGSAALFIRWGLDYASPLALLMLRFSLALVLLVLIGLPRRQWWPAAGTRWQVAWAGLVMIGGYALCYALALDNGITPGLLATLLGVQPILTLLLTERQFPARRLLGLCISLGGLALVVLESLLLTGLSVMGLVYALLALVGITAGSLMQKNIQQPPIQVLPLQYLVTLLLCVLFIPAMPLTVDWQPLFAAPLLWLVVVISVVAQLLLYRMIRSGNLVNVTALFYLVPVVTVLLDYLVFGNTLPALALVGMGAILGGLVLVFRAPLAAA